MGWHAFEITSEALRGNPLGDPHVRPLHVWTPEGDGPYPAVYLIQGMTGMVEAWFNVSPFTPSYPDEVERLSPKAVVVLVDAFTAYGGSQFVDSPGTGKYHTYLCDEVVPFVDARYPTRADREHRGISGKSSGGYGAMVVPMLRPDVFSALASHAGDALFECCYLPDFPSVARQLRDSFDGSWEVFHERYAQAPAFDFSKYGKPMEMYGYACAYSPDPDRPGEAIMPFDIATGRLEDDVWAQWLDLDPVRMAPKHADALRAMRRIYLDAGRSDEWYLDLGASAFAAELEGLGVAHTIELFDGRHGGITYRYPGAIRELVLALRS
jgi:hypothetical protein